MHPPYVRPGGTGRRRPRGRPLNGGHVSQAEAPADGKADFDHIYNAPDPRAYYRTLCALDYEIPQLALPVVQALLSAQAAVDPEPARQQRVLDVCCSYGINAALLRLDLSLDELHRRYTSTQADDLSPDELARADAELFAELRQPAAPRVTGLDIADSAVDYGVRAGLIADGWAEDLQSEDPSAGLVTELADVDLVLTTGGVGYVTEPTFDRLLSTDRPTPPWVAAWVLRIYPYDAIAETLSEHGLVTEKLDGVTFRQRRFASADEQAAAVDGVTALGLDPTGLEADGRFYAELFVSRPAADAAQQPLRELLAAAAG